MPLYAIDDIDDAWTATREFLTPLSIRRLFVLAVVVFFVGGLGTSFPGGGGGMGGARDAEPVPGAEVDVVRQFLLENSVAIGVIVGVLLAIGLAFLLIGALMEFVFVQSLRTDEVRFRDYSRAYASEGLRLFGFRVALGVVSLLATGGVVGTGLLAADAILEVGGGTGGLLFPFVSFVSAVLLLVVGIVDAFTTAFIVPVMLVRGIGVIAAWRRFWSTLVRNWKQYLAYGIAALVLNVVAGIVFGLLLTGVAIALGVPFALVVAAVSFLGSESALIAVAVVLGAAFVLALAVAALLIQVPIQSYLRYYALFVLGDTDSALDPIPERRADVRSDGTTS